MRRFFARRPQEQTPGTAELERDAARGRALVEESPRLLAVLDEEGRVVAASRRARDSIHGIRVGEALPPGIETSDDGARPGATYDAAGRTETVVYFREPEEAEYEELRIGFTAAVSHELRTPLARLLALLETAVLPVADVPKLIAQARGEVEAMGELIDDILFLSELDTGRAVVALGSTPALAVVEEVFDRLRESAGRADVTLRAEGDPTIELPLRRRMLDVVVENLAANAIRYAGPGATFAVRVSEGDLTASDDGNGVAEEDLPRLFERFYRADRARASRGTGLGLAIVKHVVTSAGGSVDASGGRGRGLTVRCRF